MKRPFLILPLLALVAGAVWLAARGCGAGDPVERLVAEMVPIPGRDYRMGKFEVTQRQWEAVMGKNPSEYKGAFHPVETVSWDDCQAFLEKLNAHPAARASGLVFRLPTEEEWEFACRAGSTNEYCRLADGTEITEAMLGRVAWFEENALTRPRWLAGFLAFAERLVDHVYEVDWAEKYRHKPVGRKEPNAWGLHDMHGNVWEWTEKASMDTMLRVCQGGCWLLSATDCKFSSQLRYSPDYGLFFNGLRLCASGRAGTTPADRDSEASAPATRSPAEETYAESAEPEP
jgi:formylglycine-generating enzyme required for sulfatase activity